MIVVVGVGLLFVLYMALGHPEVWDQAPAARNWAVLFLYPWLLLVGYMLGRKRRGRKPLHYMAQCGYCGASELIPGNIKPEDREAWAVHWAKEHNKGRHDDR